ncbi:MAG: NADH-quinone oxidoreductase subunit N [Planctomycetaceae bacterium]
MNLGALLTTSLNDTLQVSLPLFRPELCLAATVVLVLLCRMLPVLRWLDSSWIALGGALFALAYAWGDMRAFPGSPWFPGASAAFRRELFGGLLVFDPFTAYLRLLLTGFLVLYVPFTKITGIPGKDEATDFHVLLLGSVLGMCLMVSANHMLMVFMAVEMASVPSYALAGFLKGRKASSEAALKYAVYGAGAAGIMLYGISLLVGVLGSFHLPTMAARLSPILAAGGAGGATTALVLGGLMVAVGLAFKLSAVPFHFWCPDVFEGAAAEVGAFLSVASKAAAVGLAVRLGCTLTAPPTADALQLAGLADARMYGAHVVGLLAALTCTLGNLAAYGQTNMKRLLAYSTIAHAGYLMMGVAAAIALGGVDRTAARDAVAAVAFYLGAYLFMNLAAFAIVALLRNTLRSEEIAAYSGLIQSSPGVVVAMGLVLVSLIGLPPLAGFTAKFLVFAAVSQAITLGAEKPLMVVLLAIGGLNTVFSLVYYLRVLAVMIFSPPPADRVNDPLPLVSLPGAFVTGLVAPVVVLGVFFAGLYACAQFAGGFAS